MFDWDEANIAHIAEHGVTPSEAEEAISNLPIDISEQFRNGETRLFQIGETNAGRVLVIITTMRQSAVRVVTAFAANRAYRKFYAAQKAKDIHD